MNTHKTFSLLAAALMVAGQATLFAVDTHASAQSRDSHENSYQAKTVQSKAAYAITQNASTSRGA